MSRNAASFLQQIRIAEAEVGVYLYCVRKFRAAHPNKVDMLEDDVMFIGPGAVEEFIEFCQQLDFEEAMGELRAVLRRDK